MKRTELNEIKNLEINTLRQRVKKAKAELADSVMDKNMGQVKDVKSIWKKRKNIAQMLTILRQKQLISELESVGQIKSEHQETSESVIRKSDIQISSDLSDKPKNKGGKKA